MILTLSLEQIETSQIENFVFAAKHEVNLLVEKDFQTQLTDRYNLMLPFQNIFKFLETRDKEN